MFPDGHPCSAIAVPRADPEQCLQPENMVQPSGRLVLVPRSPPARWVAAVCPPLLETQGFTLLSVGFGRLSPSLILPSPWADL